MVYVETLERNGKTYYYLTKNIRLNPKKWKKIRVYAGDKKPSRKKIRVLSDLVEKKAKIFSEQAKNKTGKYKKNILLFNVGSSSIKYKYFEGKIEKKSDYIQRVKDFKKEIKKIIFDITKGNHKINAIGHRVVHGKNITHSVKISRKILQKLEEASELAPLHNPPEIKAIKICMKDFKTPNIAVFDTAFHQTMPEKAYNYAIPRKLRKLGIRKYGFHGTSHKFILEEAEKILKKKNPTIITCHIGNGCSMTAIKDGKSVDTSMGMTPLEGLMMGTRSGDIDPGIFNFLVKKGHNADKIEKILNKESGLLGVSGISNDMRDIIKRMKTNKNAKLAYDMFIYRIKKYLGSYFAILGKVDAVVFTAGVSINPFIRKDICTGLENLGIKIDAKRNSTGKKTFSKASSKTKLFYIPTNEEEMMRKEVEEVLRNQ